MSCRTYLAAAEPTICLRIFRRLRRTGAFRTANWLSRSGLDAELNAWHMAVAVMLDPVVQGRLHSGAWNPQARH